MTQLTYTPVGAIAGIVAGAHATFKSGRTRDLNWRKKQIRAIIALAEENTDAITEALRADLRRPEFEAVVAETMTVVNEARHALSHVDSWIASTSVPTPPALFPGSSWTVAEPLGTSTIIGPWNFPIQLLLCPLVSALAAGCTAVLKPSEVSPNCAMLLQTLVEKYLDPDAVRVVQGGVAETTELLAQRVDVILYTGNSQIARIVAAAAAKNLTPCILELGGKCPTIVAADADMDVSAKRIIASKLMNAGQVCLACDYILVEASAEERLLAALRRALTAFYGPDPQASPSLGRIVNGRHWERVMGYLKGCGGEVVVGGNSDAADLYISPTIIRKPAVDSSLMREEIFGPLLPVLPVASIDEAVAFVNARPKPLALYIFTNSNKTANKVIGATSSGAAVVNEAVIQITNADLPFGGVGESGLGAYHGHVGFKAFSHTKAVYRPWRGLDMGALRYPPYTPAQLRRIGALLTYMPQSMPSLGWKDLLIGGLVVAVGVLAARLHAAEGK